MKLRLHDTLTREKQDFAPLDPSNVRMYVCGPTVYDLAHIGNARPVVVFDVLYRLLKRLYPRVTYVRNITDIDDKIIERARESGEKIDAITQRTTSAYQEDMRAIGALDPTVEPRATQHIGQMIAVIESLIAKGHAYFAEGHVLFSVPSDAEYGKLSGRSRDEQIAGARVDVAPYKRDPADFVLWKPSTPTLPGWESPWGRGRPGWHIECSAMAAAHLGTSFDIHGGGHDLIFPHHENEIAQSECAHGAAMARYWLHNGFLEVNGAKMSKSLGNFFTVRELLEKWPGEAIRLLLLKTHYRAPLDFTEDGLREAKKQLDRWYDAKDQLRFVGSIEKRERKRIAASGNLTAFDPGALLDDLNSSAAISEIHAMASEVLEISRGLGAHLPRLFSLFGESPITATHEATIRTADPDLANAIGRLRALKTHLKEASDLLGLLAMTPLGWREWLPARLRRSTKRAIRRLILEREAARVAKDFRRADQLRFELNKVGVEVEDRQDRFIWRWIGIAR